MFGSEFHCILDPSQHRHSSKNAFLQRRVGNDRNAVRVPVMNEFLAQSVSVDDFLESQTDSEDEVMGDHDEHPELLDTQVVDNNRDEADECDEREECEDAVMADHDASNDEMSPQEPLPGVFCVYSWTYCNFCCLILF